MFNWNIINVGFSETEQTGITLANVVTDLNVRIECSKRAFHALKFSRQMLVPLKLFKGYSYEKN